jgi:hypothetical protein
MSPPKQALRHLQLHIMKGLSSVFFEFFIKKPPNCVSRRFYEFKSLGGWNNLPGIKQIIPKRAGLLPPLPVNCIHG